MVAAMGARSCCLVMPLSLILGSASWPYSPCFCSFDFTSVKLSGKRAFCDEI